MHICIARHPCSKQFWIVVSSQRTSMMVFEEYGLRFDIGEHSLDDRSDVLQLEASFIRNADALIQLCFVLAITTLYLVSQGTVLVEQGRPRWVDPHWFRGNNCAKIGSKWIKRALSHSWTLITRLYVPGGPDPEPAKPSRRQHVRRATPAFRCAVTDFAPVIHL